MPMTGAGWTAFNRLSIDNGPAELVACLGSIDTTDRQTDRGTREKERQQIINYIQMFFIVFNLIMYLFIS